MKAVIDLDEILGPRDEHILQTIISTEPSISDNVINYYLGRVGCVTTDPAATRLLSVGVQVAFEKAVDEAKLLVSSTRRDGSAYNRLFDPNSSSLLNNTRLVGPKGCADGVFDPQVSSCHAPGSVDGSREVSEIDVDSLCRALQKNGPLSFAPSLDLLLQPISPSTESRGS